MSFHLKQLVQLINVDPIQCEREGATLFDLNGAPNEVGEALLCVELSYNCVIEPQVGHNEGPMPFPPSAEPRSSNGSHGAHIDGPG